MVLDFISFRFIDFIDIFLVALLMYQIYTVIKGTVAINIFVGLFSFYLVWLIVKALNMQLLSSILGQFIGVGVIALIIVFQQEIRRFLILVGTKYFFNHHFSFENLFNISLHPATKDEVDAIINAVENMAKTKTGALIVISQKNELKMFQQTGEIIDAKITQGLLESVFFKNSPLHDGAVIIVGNRLQAAKCILPMTVRRDIPKHYGMRHRSAIGMSDETHTFVLVVSEESGNVTYIRNGVISPIEDLKQLHRILTKYMVN